MFRNYFEALDGIIHDSEIMSRKKLHKSEKKLSDLGNRINILLKSAQLNQSGLAKQLDLSNSYITEIMQGRTKKGGIKFWDSIKREFTEWENYLRGYVKESPRTPPEGSIFNPGSTFGTNGIDIYGYHFRNKIIAMKCVNLMWNLEQLDADLFKHTEICLQMLLDGANIMEKKAKNQS